MSVDPIPAVVEAEATGETARLFGELRDTLGVPFVNLIWRHLATIPGGLPWTWALLKPIYLSPTLGTAAAAVLASIDPPVAALPGFVFDAVGVRGEDRLVIRAMLDDYNRANALNFLGLSLACLVLRGAVVPDTEPDRILPQRPPRRELPPLPPLLALDALEPPLRALVNDLDQFGRIGRSEAIGSLWRHLAHWPGFLALVHASLRPFARDGSLRQQQESVIQAAQPLLHGELRSGLRGIPEALSTESEGRVLSGLDQFTRLMICRMTVLGVSMRSLLPKDEAEDGAA